MSQIKLLGFRQKMLLNKKQRRVEQKYEKNQPKNGKTVLLSKQSGIRIRTAAVATRQKSLKSAICSPVQFIPNCSQTGRRTYYEKVFQSSGLNDSFGNRLFSLLLSFPAKRMFGCFRWFTVSRTLSARIQAFWCDEENTAKTIAWHSFVELWIKNASFRKHINLIGVAAL